MKLDYLPDLTDNGKYPGADPDKVIRLYDFNQTEARQLSELIQDRVIDGKKSLDLALIPYVEQLNCRLVFEIAERDLGIAYLPGNVDFICRLTVETYRLMRGYMQPFTNEENSLSGYNWLYDPDIDQIDLLFSAGGTW